jgi:hypothetical protein
MLEIYGTQSSDVRVHRRPFQDSTDSTAPERGTIQAV